MRPPADRRDDAEIIADIVELADPSDDDECLLDVPLSLASPRTIRDVLRDYARRLIDDLRATPSTFTGNRKENTEYATEVHKLAVNLARKLTRPESQFLTERFWALGNTHGDTIEFNPQTRDWVAQDARLEFIARELDWLCSQCGRVIELEIGEHGSVQYQQRHAAIAAHMMLREAANLTNTELQLTDSPTGKLCRLASLFYEAATGCDADLRWHCQEVLRVKTPK
jgi:hypothetical protein